MWEKSVKISLITALLVWGAAGYGADEQGQTSSAEAISLKAKLIAKASWSGENHQLDLLRNIVFEHLALNEISVKRVIEKFRRLSQKYDPEKIGLNIVFFSKFGALRVGKQFTSSGSKTIDMRVTNISMGKALKLICQTVDLQFRIERNAVVVADKNLALGQLITKIFPIEQESICEIGGDEETDAVTDYFKRRGVRFPIGTKIVYDSRISRLIATNTLYEMRKIAAIVREINVIDPMVQFTMECVRIKAGDFQRLKDEWRNGKSPEKRKSFDWSFLRKSPKSEILASTTALSLNGQEVVVRLVSERYFAESWTEPATGGKNSEKDDDGKNKNGSKTISHGVSSTPSFGTPTEVGAVLRITPNVDADHYTISADLNPVVNAQAGWSEFSIPASGNPIRMPEMEACSIETTLTMYDGHTMMLNKQSVGAAGGNGTLASQYLIINLLTANLLTPDGNPVRHASEVERIKATNRHPHSPGYLDDLAAKTLNDESRSVLERKINVAFAVTPLPEALKFLNDKSGGKLKFKREVLNSVPKITLRLKSVPLGTALRYVCLMSGLRFRAGEDGGLEVYNPRYMPMATKTFKVRVALVNSCIESEGDEWDKAVEADAGLVDTKTLENKQTTLNVRVNDYSSVLAQYFIDRGVPFPQGSSIKYDRRAGELIVTNTRPNLRSMESLLRDLDIQTPLVMVEAKMLEISQTELEGLIGEKAYDPLFDQESIRKISTFPQAKVLLQSSFLACSGSTAVSRRALERSFPEAWTGPEVSNEDGAVNFTPAIPEFGDPRDLGNRVEATPTVSPNNYTINLNTHISQLLLAGESRYQYDCQLGDKKRETGQIVMPIFARRGLMSNIKTYDGATLMAGHGIGLHVKNSENPAFLDNELMVKMLKGEVLDEKAVRQHIFFFITLRLIGNDGEPVNPGTN